MDPTPVIPTEGRNLGCWVACRGVGESRLPAKPLPYIPRSEELPSRLGPVSPT